MASSVTVSGFEDLYALYRAIVAAKMARTPFDEDVLTSDVVSRIAEKVMAALEQEAKAKNDQRLMHRLIEMKDVSWGDDQVAAAILHIERNFASWESWDASKRLWYVTQVMRPFKLDEAVSERLISVDTKTQLFEVAHHQE